MVSATQAEAATSPDLFEKSRSTPAIGSKEFSLDSWEKTRDAGIAPRFHSGYSADAQLRAEFLAGARLYGLELTEYDPAERLRELTDIQFGAQRKVQRRAEGYFEQIVPQQLMIADTLNVGHDAYGVEIPRRASKTTSIFCLLLGRCASRPGYQVTFSAQNGVAGSRRLREWASRLDAVNPPDDLDLPPWLRGRPRVSKHRQQSLALFGDDVLPAPADTGRGFRIMRGEVGKGIYFDNGSQFLVLKPVADAYRGEAADVSWLDEAQEIDPDEGEDLLAAILPLQDTKPGASIIISGTAGESRVGPFWQYVDMGRNADTDIGVIDFAVDETTPWEVIEDEDAAMAVLATVHPGIGTLTTIEKMRKNYRKLPKPQWAREYLSLWPESFGTQAVNAGQWEGCGLTRKKPRPDRVAFGLDIRPCGASAAIVAAWRDVRGFAYVEVVEHRQGTNWIPKRMQELTRTYRGSTIAFDDIAEGKATATEALMLSPRPRLKMQTYREHAAGCVQLLRDLERGKLRHFHQISLDAAVAVAAKREVRGDQGVWLWGVTASGGDITPLVAATRALRNWDQYFARGASTTGVVIAA